MKQTYVPIPLEWDNAKFEKDNNCIAYAENGVLVIASENGIDNLEEKIQTNIIQYTEILQQKQDLMNRLGLTQEDIELLLIQ
jgi:hypothetical protein